jgi:hypothetical protein
MELAPWNSSSPTGAAAIACRIPGEGRVTVSERKSMRVIGFEFLIR